MSIYLGNTEILKIYLGSTEVPKAYLGTVEVYGTGPQPIDYSKEYFTISAIEPGTITWAPTGTTEYSVNKGAWDTWNGSLAVNAGDKVRFRSTANTTYNGKRISATGKYDVEGNIMSLLYGDNFSGQTSLSTQYVFAGLLAGPSAYSDNNTLINAGNLVLPATTLQRYCYQLMFRNCVNLETAPELPATTLEWYCYMGMFQKCLKLTTPPALPSTTVADNCYASMFDSCSELRSAPTLPATALAASCYSSMFKGCRNLTSAPELPALTTANYCYQGMFSGCTSLTSPPNLPATAIFSNSYKYMFANCTSLTIPPSISARSVGVAGCQGMFQGCTALTTAPDLLTVTPSTKAYTQMFSGCTNLSSIKCLAENISAADCTTNWTSGVAASGTFTKSPNMSSWTTDANGIPAGWTVESV